jgi:hypothetical protein
MKEEYDPRDIAEAINEAAEEAAELLVVAFGYQPEGVPGPEVGWGILDEQIYIGAEHGAPWPDALPRTMPRQFKHDFARHVKRLLTKRAADARANDRGERAHNRRARLAEGRANDIVAQIRALAEELKAGDRTLAVNLLCVLQEAEGRRNGKAW